YEFLIGEPPQRWLSAMTLSTWHKEVSQIETEAGIYKASQYSQYGILVDESTCGENKYFVWLVEPTECEINLAHRLRTDFEITNNTFGLREELLDLKTHPNMMQDLKQSKLRLLSGDIDEENIALGLLKVRTNRKKQLVGLVQDGVKMHGEEEATKIFLNLYKI
ncbi:21262_t:CDS:2, partial [Racocetra persica]